MKFQVKFDKYTGNLLWPHQSASHFNSSLCFRQQCPTRPSCKADVFSGPSLPYQTAIAFQCLGYKNCSVEYGAEEVPNTIENITEVMVKIATELATAALPLGNSSRPYAAVKATFDFARKTANYAKTVSYLKKAATRNSVAGGM